MAHGAEPSVRFVCGDMLHAPLAEVGVLVLASQCWDRDLVALVHERLALGLPIGAVVVDYSDALARARPREFRLLRSITVPVSWNDKQAMAVMLRQAAGS